MAVNAAAAQPAASAGHDREVALWRLYAMRLLALLFAAGGFCNYLPHLIHPDPTARGVTTAMFAGLWLLSVLVLRYPLQMLPIFLFELVWKTLWLLAFGLPQWAAGRADPQLARDLIEIGLFPFVIGLVIPWPYVWRHYVKRPSERWR